MVLKRLHSCLTSLIRKCIEWFAAPAGFRNAGRLTVSGVGSASVQGRGNGGPRLRGPPRRAMGHYRRAVFCDCSLPESCRAPRNLEPLTLVSFLFLQHSCSKFLLQTFESKTFLMPQKGEYSLLASDAQIVLDSPATSFSISRSISIAPWWLRTHSLPEVPRREVHLGVAGASRNLPALRPFLLGCPRAS